MHNDWTQVWRACIACIPSGAQSLARVACSAAMVPTVMVVKALALVRKALVCAEVGIDILVIIFVIGAFADVDIIVVAVTVVDSAFVSS